MHYENAQRGFTLREKYPFHDSLWCDLTFACINNIAECVFFILHHADLPYFSRSNGILLYQIFHTHISQRHSRDSFQLTGKKYPVPSNIFMSQSACSYLIDILSAAINFVHIVLFYLMVQKSMSRKLTEWKFGYCHSIDGIVVLIWSSICTNFSISDNKCYVRLIIIGMGNSAPQQTFHLNKSLYLIFAMIRAHLDKYYYLEIPRYSLLHGCHHHQCITGYLWHRIVTSSCIPLNRSIKKTEKVPIRISFQYSSGCIKWDIFIVSHLCQVF